MSKTPEDYGITKYDKEKFETDGILDCFQSVFLSERKLNEIPFTFGVIYGNFDCSINNLTSLKGSPVKVNGYFNCSVNQLTSLEYGPSEVIAEYDCSYNQLKSLKGCISEAHSYFNCSVNQLNSLAYGPENIKYGFQVSDNCFNIYAWIDILQKYPKIYYQCNLVPNNTSLNETLKGLNDKLQIINMIKAS